MQAAEAADQLVAGAQIEVIGVAEDDAAAQVFGQVALRQSFDRSLSADGHEHRCLDIAVGRTQHAGAGARDRALRLDLEGDLRHESGVAAAVLMVGGNSADQELEILFHARHAGVGGELVPCGLIQRSDNLTEHGFDAFKSLHYFALHVGL